MPSKEIYPRFSVELEHLPEARDWEIGEKYYISLELEMTGLSIGEDYSSASFEIKGIRVDSKIWEMSKKEFEDYQAKVRGGKK